ncbi:MAG: septum formation inhibitor Maf [Campylobacterota bacterium]|nr:septum formation inhibitor Maf [Campylobacterota bacterium]
MEFSEVNNKIRLGSNSQTRAKILKDANINFVQSGGSFDEDKIETKEPYEFVKIASQGKFDELYAKYGIEEMPLLVADSVVVSQDRLLRKAKTKDEAREMLNLQSGTATSIITCMIFKSKSTYIFDTSKSTYYFDKFDKNDIEKYLDSNLWVGKAGAIMVEGFCKPYIKSFDGYESTAMGLCVEKLLPYI